MVFEKLVATMQDYQRRTIALEINLVALFREITVARILENYIVLMRIYRIAYELPIAKGFGIDTKISIGVFIENIQ